MKKLSALILGMAAMITSASFADSIVDGRTFYAMTDCAYAKAYPTVKAGQQITATGELCEVVVEVTDTGKLTYTAGDVVETGYVINLEKQKPFGKKVITGVGFVFKALKGAHRPLTLGNTEATVLNTGMTGFTLTTKKQVVEPKPQPQPSKLTGKIYNGLGDCGYTDKWFKVVGTMYPEGVRCEVTLSFGKGTFTYTTVEEGDTNLRVEEAGTYQVNGGEVRLFFGEDNKTTYRPTWLTKDGGLALIKGGALTLKVTN